MMLVLIVLTCHPLFFLPVVFSLPLPGVFSHGSPHSFVTFIFYGSRYFAHLNLTILFLVMPFSLSQPSTPLPSFFFYLCIFYLSIFCKLAGLVRHRVSLFGKSPA